MFPDLMETANAKRLIAELERKGYRVVEKQDIDKLEKQLAELEKIQTELQEIKETDRNGGLSVKTLTRGPSPIRTPSVGSLDSISDNKQIFKAAAPTLQDYQNPTRDFVLPPLPEEVVKQLGVENKNVLLKKNIIEKNKTHHKELPLKEYNNILQETLYNSDYVMQVQPRTKPNYFTFVKEMGNKVLVLEINNHKENFEVVGFFKVRPSSLQQYKNKNTREGGRFLITKGNKTQGAAGLSALPSDRNSITNNKQIFKAANRVRREVISEIEKRQLAGKEEMLRFLKLAKTPEEITSAVEGVLEQLRKEWEKTTEAKQEKRQLEVPATDWEKKRVELLAQFNEIIRQTDKSVTEAQKKPKMS